MYWHGGSFPRPSPEAERERGAKRCRQRHRAFRGRCALLRLSGRGRLWQLQEIAVSLAQQVLDGEACDANIVG